MENDPMIIDRLYPLYDVLFCLSFLWLVCNNCSFQAQLCLTGLIVKRSKEA
jgi:hypothetical protein